MANPCTLVLVVASMAYLATVSDADQGQMSLIASQNYQENRRLVQEILDREPVLYQEITAGQLTPTGLQNLAPNQGAAMYGGNMMNPNGVPSGYGAPAGQMYNQGFMGQGMEMWDGRQQQQQQMMNRPFPWNHQFAMPQQMQQPMQHYQQHQGVMPQQMQAF